MTMLSLTPEGPGLLSMDALISITGMLVSLFCLGFLKSGALSWALPPTLHPAWETWQPASVDGADPLPMQEPGFTGH